jgi:hypothetical protein
MSSILFGNTINMLTVATSSGYVIAYDLDGILKQKDEFGVITEIGGGGSNIGGTQYIFVKANGTDIENAVELQAAYDLAKTMSPSIDNRITVVVAPGNYKFPSTFVMDTEYIDLVSLTGNRDVIFDLDGITDPFQFDGDTFDILSIGECLLIDTDNVFVKGIKGKFYLSTNQNDFLGSKDYVLPLQVSDNLPGIVVENCEGGLFSFGGDFTFGSNAIEVNGTFKNCQGSKRSFGGDGGTASGIFTDCIGGDSSFGFIASGTFTDCIGDDGSFGSNGIASGTFTNCQSSNAFGANGTASGTFINCQGDTSSFGGNVEASGTFTNCQGGDGSFGGNNGEASGIFTNCQAGDGSFGGNNGTASGKFKDCIGGKASFGGQGESSGTFTNCIGDDFSFGGQAGIATGIFTNCIGGELSFGGLSGIASGTFTNCQAGDGSFGGDNGTASGSFTNCIGGELAFGANIFGTLSGRLFYCRLTIGTFQTVSSGGRTYYCVDGDGNVNNQ